MSGERRMSSLAMEVEASGQNRNPRLTQWVEEAARLCQPDRVHWCDGSTEEYQAMLRLMVLSGVAIPLDPRKRPNSVLVRSNPATAPGWKIARSFARRTRRMLDQPTTGKIPRK